MAIKLKIKKRDEKLNVSIPLSLAKAIIEKESKDELRNIFKDLVENDTNVSDVEWLKLIVNHVPEGGLPLTKMAKWLPLAERVNDLDENKEGTFTLSQFQTDLIWERLRSDKFILHKMPSAFVSFILDFKKTTGKHFSDEEPEEVETVSEE